MKAKVFLIAVALVAPAITHAADAAAALDLAKRNNCLACHTLDKKIVGPAWKDVGKKYAGDAGAEAKLIAKVKNGGAGVWGSVPMPSNPAIKDADIKILVRYALSL